MPRILIIGWETSRQHPLYLSWAERAGTQFSPLDPAGAGWEQPPEADLVVTAQTSEQPVITSLRVAAEAGIPTLLLADGILEYRNTFAHPQVTPSSHYMPVVAHKMACIGPAQARIVESWGNPGRCEIVGLPHLDAWLRRPRPARPDGRPWRLLIATATTPCFSEEEEALLLSALRDLRDACAPSSEAGAEPMEVWWRLTRGLDARLGVANHVASFRDLPLEEALDQVDACITTPSTVQLLAAARGLPTAVLDYTLSPQTTPSAWLISAPGHCHPVLRELRHPPPAKLEWQRQVVEDHLCLDGGATDRLLHLMEEMVACGRRARAAGLPLEPQLQRRLLPAPEPPAPFLTDPLRFAAAFASHPDWDQSGPFHRQEVLHLRRQLRDTVRTADSLREALRLADARSAGLEEERTRLQASLEIEVNEAQSLRLRLAEAESAAATALESARHLADRTAVLDTALRKLQSRAAASPPPPPTQ